MKKLWLVLLSLGLLMAFSVSASAADVKFSGEYYAAGLYMNHVNLQDPALTYSRSTAFFYQRLRLGTDFVVSPCLRLVTRMDIMERVWEPDDTGNDAFGRPVAPGITNDARNLDFDIVYVDYTSPIGKFQVGYQPDYMWGTIWANRTTGPTAPQIKYFLPIGPVVLFAGFAKEDENDYSVQYPLAAETDRDQNSYRIGPIFNFKGNNVSGEAGVLFTYDDVRQYSGPAVGFFEQDVYTVQPYFKAKFGPVALQGEVNYAFGQRDFETNIPGTIEDRDINSWSAFLDGDVNLGIFDFGGSFAFVQGQDFDDTTANGGDIQSQLSGGRDWDPCLILFNNTTQVSWIAPRITTWVPAVIEGLNYKSSPTGEMRNAYFGQLRFGVKPVPKLRLATSVSYAAAHEKPNVGFGDFDRDYGWEVDVTGTYKITNNLSYMLGGGYFFTGDYFQAGNDALDLNDDFIIINKLTLAF
ncbi:MAG TPA: hypothetical protein PLF58_11085 [Smithella sp.]|nr:hypothetical protein [Smithella sp.]HOS15202.1 hypothetical protein [Smithella sp.]HPL48816.1 hypothetical protein [Smithella sp.]